MPFLMWKHWTWSVQKIATIVRSLMIVYYLFTLQYVQAVVVEPGTVVIVAVDPDKTVTQLLSTFVVSHVHE